MVGQFVRRAARHQQVQIFDKLADADPLLVSEDDTGKRDSDRLSFLSDSQQVGILRQQGSPQLRRSCE